jgi:RNA polymerase sigma-70 factor (ECF subfamily)
MTGSAEVDSLRAIQAGFLDQLFSGLGVMDSSLSDEDLVEGILSGDEYAFSGLYERYKRPIYSTAYRITQNTEEAQDATQEIFLKLFRSLRSWDAQKSKLSTWIYRLAANHAIDCWRARSRRAESQLSEDNAERIMRTYALGSGARSPFGDVKSREEVGVIRRCVESLPDLQKKAFILRYFQELKLSEIADMENCSLGTVKASLFRATQAARRSLRKSRGLS